MKQKHMLRWVSQAVGIVLTFAGLADGWADVFPYLHAAWPLASGVALVGLGARKRPVSVKPE